jgi:hypothetical protein
LFRCDFDLRVEFLELFDRLDFFDRVDFSLPIGDEGLEGAG